MLENVYVDIRSAEQKMNCDHIEPTQSLVRLVCVKWDCDLKNSEFITMVNSENLHRAKHLKKSETVNVYSRKFVSMVEDILFRGVAAGQFGVGIDPVQLNITVQSSTSIT